MKVQRNAAIKYPFRAVGLLCLMLFMMTLKFDDPALAQTTQTIAFVNVNVIPMDTERVLESQTGVVENGLITAIGPAAEVSVPDGSETIDGNGAYLMPGLADMHTHLSYDADPAFMRLFLAEGVTTVRNLNAIVPDHFQWRDQVVKGELPGPTIYTSGNSFYGVPPS